MRSKDGRKKIKQSGEYQVNSTHPSPRGLRSTVAYDAVKNEAGHIPADPKNRAL